MSKVKRRAECHPEREHYAYGICKSCYMAKYNETRVVLPCHLEARRVRCKELKKKALTMYGKEGHLQCSWDGCGVTDLDMLTLDHKNDDGYIDRKTSNMTGSVVTYRAALVKCDFEKYQTLCWNHQWKKRITSLDSSSLRVTVSENT